MIIGRHDFYPNSRSDAPKRQIPINISSLKSSISHLHQPASNLEHHASPNPIDPFPENDATTTPQPPTPQPPLAESLLQALRAFHDGMCQDMNKHTSYDEMRQNICEEASSD